MNRTFAFTTPRLVGAFVLALGLLVAGLAVGLGPAGAVMDSGGEEPSITELNWQCNDEIMICECDSLTVGDCDALVDANPECANFIEFADGFMWCQMPPGSVIVHPDGTRSVVPEEDTRSPIDPGLILRPGGSNGEADSGRTSTPDQPQNPEEPTDPEDPENPGEGEEPEQPEEPPTHTPPRIDPPDVLDREDLPGAADPGRTGDTGNSRTDPDTGSLPLDPGGLDR